MSSSRTQCTASVILGRAPSVILRGCEEILSEGGSEGRERRIFGYTGSTLPTERRRNHRPRCATNRTVCAIGPSPAGVTEDPSLPPLGPAPAQDFFTTSERGPVLGAGARDLSLHGVHAAH